MRPLDAHPADCPPFVYEQHPERSVVLPRRVAHILVGLRNGQINTVAAAADTREVHGALFAGLTPPGHDYYAGHYRGEEYRCLRRYRVRVGVDYGAAPERVIGRMGEMAQSIRDALVALDAGRNQPDSVIRAEVKLLFIVQVACRYFVLLSQIHPYANGNGHAARFCLWAILARYGYFPAQWPIEPRPPDPPYTEMLLRYRLGDREPLEGHVLRCLLASE